MVYDRKKFQDDLEIKRREKVLRNERELRQIAQSEVPISAMTGSAEWDYFLSIVQGQIDALGAALMTLRAANVLDPSFEHADLAMRKAQQMQLAVQIDTLERVRDLPKQIIEQGEKAKLALHKYADK
jgi:hypothetical protein